MSDMEKVVQLPRPRILDLKVSAKVRVRVDFFFLRDDLKSAYTTRTLYDLTRNQLERYLQKHFLTKKWPKCGNIILPCGTIANNNIYDTHNRFPHKSA